MPYINMNDRFKFANLFAVLPRIETAGELNYLITQLARKYIIDHGLRYEHINAVEGVLSAASKEFYRRVAAPYEDKKIKENGDVYVPDFNGRVR